MKPYTGSVENSLMNVDDEVVTLANKENPHKAHLLLKALL